MNGGGWRGRDGRFSGPRLDVESVPRLPTFPARWTLEDPRGQPYFVFWTKKGGQLDYHLRMAKLRDGNGVVVSTPEGARCRIDVFRRPLPRRGGMALLYRCPRCGNLRRYLYGYALRRGNWVDEGIWQCHRCARLLFMSQGRYRRNFERALFAAMYGDARVREPFARRPRDPRAVSYPGMVMSEFPGALTEQSVATG